MKRFLTEIMVPSRDGCTEMRVMRAEDRSGFLQTTDQYPRTFVGWFNDPNALYVDGSRVRGINGFVTVNPVLPELMAVGDPYRNRVGKVDKKNGFTTTLDVQIARLRNIYFDLDPIKFASDGRRLRIDCSATQEEMGGVVEVRDRFLDDHPEIKACSIWGRSGNGCYVLPRIPDYLPDEQHIALVRRFLAYLGRKYTTDKVEIDPKTFNPSRIMGFIGTMKCKGANTPERPWRFSTIDSPADHVRGTLDLEAWLEEHDDTPLASIDPDEGGTGWIGEYRTKVKVKKARQRDARMPARLEGYGRQALINEAEKVASAPPGERNNKLNEATFNLAKLIDCGVLAEADIVEAMTAAGIAAGLADHEIPGTIASGLDGGRRCPRTLEEIEAKFARDDAEQAAAMPVLAAEDDFGFDETAPDDPGPDDPDPRIANGHVGTNGHPANGFPVNGIVGPVAEGPRPVPAKRSRKPQAPRQRDADDPDGQPPNGREGGAGGPRKPVIPCRDISLEVSTGLTLDVLSKTNTPPTMFDFGGSLAWIKASRDQESRAHIELMSQDAIRNRLAEIATFMEMFEGKKGDYEVEVFPPSAVVRAVMAQKHWDDRVAPPLELLVPTPRFLPGGSMVTEPGYHPGSRIFYRPPRGLDWGEIPKEPDADQVANARELILKEYLVDFPFENQPSRANAMACMLLPFVRPMIKGPTPMHLFEASTEGTGKGKLANACAFPSLGRELSSTSQKEDESEWRKTLTTTLLAGATHVYIDNLYNPRGYDGGLAPIDSANLALALTQPEWEDRLLGGNKLARIRVRCIWMASGNNIEWSRELGRRIVPIRLLVPTEDPSTRRGFHCDPDTLEEWAVKNWSRLVGACLTLIQHWVADGMPVGKVRMGSYESYSQVMGGILHSAAVEGFLENRTMDNTRNRESSRWPTFVRSWNAYYGQTAVSATDLYALIFGRPDADGGPIKGDPDLQVAFVDLLGEKTALSQKQRLGRALAKQENRVYGDFRIVQSASVSLTGNYLYRLVSINPAIKDAVAQDFDMDDPLSDPETPF